MEPEVTAALTKYGLVVIMDLLMAYPAGVDGRGVGVGGIEDHGLIGGVDFSSPRVRVWGPWWALRTCRLGVHVVLLLMLLL